LPSEEGPPAGPPKGSGPFAGLRQRLIPRSVLGVVVLLLAAAIGAGFSGTVLYAYYQYRLQKAEDRIEKFIDRFDNRYDSALKGIAKERDEARQQVQKELEPLRELRASGATLRELINKVKDSVYLIDTQDDLGQSKVGSAFVVTADAERSYLVTALSVVRAATRRPGPGIILRNGDQQVPATLWTWQEERDLALLVVDKGSLPRIKWAPSGQAAEFGERVFVVAGIGGAGGSITQGFVADVSASGIQHDAAATGAFAGGPLLNSKGELLGMATTGYAPLGFTSDRVTFAPPIRSVCEKVLKCPEGGTPDAGSAGTRR
jgi:S1-C subfamily serine protease